MCVSDTGRRTYDLVGEDENVVLFGDGSELLELFTGEDLANGIMRGVEDEDLGLGGDGSPVVQRKT